MKHPFPKVSIILISIFSLIFLLDSFLFDNLLLQWGTLNTEVLFSNNQWWRIITSSFFHVGIIHIIVNSISLYYAGLLIESKIGSGWFLLVFLISNLVERIIFAFLFTPVSSIGSSPGIYGLMGVILVYCIRDRKFLIAHKKNREMTWLISFFIIGNLLGWDTLFVHTVGFILGILLGVILMYFNTTTNNKHKNPLSNLTD